MNIFKHELKRNVFQVLIWFVILLIILVTASYEFEVFNGDEELKQFMDMFDPFFKALGMEGTDFTTATGYLSITSLFLYLPLSFYSGLAGLSMLSKEEHKRTSEFLLTMPVKRQTVLTAKLLVAVICSLLLNILIHGGTYIVFARFDQSAEFQSFLLNLAIGIFIIQMIFMSIGFLISMMVKRQNQQNGVFIGIVLGTFMLSMLVGFLENSYFFPYLTPFQYYTANKMISGTYETSYLIISAILIIGPILYCYKIYPKRNIHL